jgi:hypothetical protein
MSTVKLTVASSADDGAETINERANTAASIMASVGFRFVSRNTFPGQDLHGSDLVLTELSFDAVSV